MACFAYSVYTWIIASGCCLQASEMDEIKQPDDFELGQNKDIVECELSRVWNRPYKCRTCIALEVQFNQAEMYISTL